jgi:hypothetical protein
MNIQISDVTDAMFSSIEGYVISVVDSMEFSLSRKLTNEEHTKVYDIVNNSITNITINIESNKI